MRTMARIFISSFCLALAVLASSVAALPQSDKRRSLRLYQSSSSSQHPSSNVQCGGTLMSTSGEITSPNFPRSYPDEVDCRWKIVGEKGSRITISFSDFGVETSHDCEYDSLEIYDGSIKDDSKRLAKLCGTTTMPQVVVSRESSVLIRFHSDFSVNFKGFRLYYTQSGCSHRYTGMRGTISSPNHPNAYPLSVDCTYEIEVPQRHIVALNFLRFKVEVKEDSSGCVYDYVEVYDGPSLDSPTLGRFCGKTIPTPLRSTSNTMVIKFVADQSISHEGFSAQFRAESSELAAAVNPTHTSKLPRTIIPWMTSSSEHAILAHRRKLIHSKRLEQLKKKELQEEIGRRKKISREENFFKKRKTFRTDKGRRPEEGKPRNTQNLSNSTDPKNPCALNNGGCSHVCNNQRHTRVCSCHAGYVLDFDEETCKDINECQSSNGRCHGLCINTLGSFQCGCGPGFTLSKDNRTCININECATKQHKCDQLCRDTDGGYYCECHKGYKVGGDGFSCTDLDECELPQSHHHCSHICVNTPGSYYCKCRDGFLLSANGRICRDQDECMMGGVKCNQQCINTPGSYYCSCFQGFRMSARIPNKCEDVNECQEGLPDCHRCTNIDGSYYCECDDGYVAINNRTKCRDIDECMANNGGCSQLCVNTAGGYHCKCEAGYKATDPEYRTCTDINECAPHQGTGDCDHMCTNIAGSFKCSCHAGYEMSIDGLTCQDIDECAVNNGGCNHKCINTPGNYSCACHDGYLNKGRNGSDYICEDFDECIIGLHTCVNGSTCVNTPGNYTCTCPSGYNTEWNKCIDVDECSQKDVHNCEQLCNNTDGSFHCYCLAGYNLNANGKTCSDVDECLQGMCERECINIKGSYLCMCPEGSSLSDDKRHCQDINECSVNNGNCDQVCVNTNGSYHCQCKTGYQLLRDGKTCRDIDECKMNSACCNHGCVNTEGGYNCTCYQGFSLTSKCTCTDVDECATRNGGCQQICTNKPGSYGCYCPTGFVVDSVDSSRCVDIDECKTDNGGCQHNCTNTIGTYQCTCHPKFKLQADGKSCGHCPTCDDFESLIETVQILKKQVASLEAWRQSTHTGCIDEYFGFHPEQSSWKSGRCDICSCEKGRVMCEPIMGCHGFAEVIKATTPATNPLSQLPTTDGNTGSTSDSTPSTSKSDEDDSGLFSNNRRRMT